MAKFNVGDRVVCVTGMAAGKVLKGKTGTVRLYATTGYPTVGVEWDDDIGGHAGRDFFTCPMGHGWFVDEADLELLPGQHAAKKIIITNDGETTTARLYDGKQVIREATARCSANDEFSVEIGARLTMARLFPEELSAKADDTETPAAGALPDDWEGELFCVKSYKPGEFTTRGKRYAFKPDKWPRYDDGWRSVKPQRVPIGIYIKYNKEQNLYPLINRAPVAGEWVLVVNACGTFDKYENGSVLKIVKAYSDDGVFCARYGNGCGEWLKHGEYLVIHGYDGRYETK